MLTLLIPVALTLVAALGGALCALVSWGFLALAVVAGLFAVVAWHDVLQRRHSILRNYPVIGHLRFLLEAIRPELQQYFIERNVDGRPFPRDTRTIVYERAKGIAGEKSFGTELDVNAVVTAADGMLRRLVGERVTLDTCLTSDRLPVRADPVQLEQVLGHLLGNSIDLLLRTDYRPGQVLHPGRGRGPCESEKNDTHVARSPIPRVRSRSLQETHDAFVVAVESLLSGVLAAPADN